MRRFVALTIAWFAVIAAPAVGASGIVGGDAGFLGVTSRGSELRYLAQQVPGGTLVMAIDRRGGRMQESRFVHEPLIVAAAAFDGAGTGLSADGRLLVLSPPRGTIPRRRSDFVVVATGRLQPVADLRLRGDFSLDAISPDGSRLYFIELTGGDETRYRVRAYDLTHGRLLPKPVVDPAEADEPMRGLPVARTMSQDGRWAYTLYDGDGKEPFIHALDTERGRAKCIDLDALAGRQDLMGMRLAVTRGGTIEVRDQGTPELAVDPRTFAVHAPRFAPPAPPPAPDDGGGIGWLAPVAGGALLALLAAAALALGGGRRARRLRMR
jgi:hypothetical protein